MNQRNQTKQILAHLSGQVGKLPGKETDVVRHPAWSHSLQEPRLLAVFAGNPIGLEQTIQTLTSWKKKGYTYDAAFSANAEALMESDAILRALQPVQVIHRNMQELKHYTLNHLSGVLVPQITHNTARKLVQGIQDGLVPNLLWQALWDGIPVYMNLESLNTYHGRPTQNQAMNRIMKQTISSLKEMGVREMNQFQGVKTERVAAGKDLPDVINRDQMAGAVQVITEKDVLTHAAGATLVVEAGAIVTPLARDTAVEKGIQLIRKT
ncbi:hypothetical protein [Anoxynatronum sibiricum]|uniref:Flavoprotein n=1 Tax=Anoxynatronum sibiricum TaxID=210623 RepID=A0ABU9VPC7_9CLOT